MIDSLLIGCLNTICPSRRANARRSLAVVIFVCVELLSSLGAAPKSSTENESEYTFASSAGTTATIRKSDRVFRKLNRLAPFSVPLLGTLLSQNVIAGEVDVFPGKGRELV
jgi:hypothetical protein